MANVLVLGAGLNGLATALLLMRDGHEVTVVERDPAPPSQPGETAWTDWSRRGVNQFRLPHYMLPRWTAVMRRELPDVLDALTTAGAIRTNAVEMLPPALRGPRRDGDDRFDTITARRPVLESVLAARVPVRRGVTVTGLLMRGNRVTGVRTEGGDLTADLVVDCGGRRSSLGSWLAAAGAPAPVEEREDCGFVYYGRHFAGILPSAECFLLQQYESLSILTLPADNGTWSVVLVTSARDHALRRLRDATAWDAVLARYPLAAHWRAGTPISGVDVMAGIEDRYRRLVAGGEPVATGIVAVGDAWACTNPTLGRGASLGLLHACGLRDVLRETGTDDPDKLVRRFDEWTMGTMTPLYRQTLWLDRHRLAELDADAVGVLYAPDDPQWRVSTAMAAASLVDPGLVRDYLSLSSFLTTPDELFTTPGLLDRVISGGMGSPRYPLPGPDRQALLATLDERS